ncbi:MAG: GNAT family N-acetyltransferase [bacterium]|nr:GNAT family N-acetyltransferase [bacterium]
MYGVYTGSDEDRPVGFIGLHEGGAMGMLYVDERYRRQGLAISLENWLINQLLRRGETPYCQIGEENVPALKLQEKIGLYLCDEPMWWLST